MIIAFDELIVCFLHGTSVDVVSHHQKNIYINLVNKKMHLSLIILPDMTNNFFENSFYVLSTFDYAWREIFILMIHINYAT